MLDFRMDTFLTVCRYMNFTKAAEILSITQPGVSQHIHYLETCYGAKLFKYDKKKMRLTDAGDILYKTAVRMKHDELYLKESITDFDTRKKRLVFGATLTIGEFVIGEHLKDYLAAYPDAQVKMLIGNTSELLASLRLGEIDFALVEGNFSKNEYDHLIYSKERYIPVCGKDYSFQSEPNKLEDLLTHRIIVRETGSGTREILEKNLEYRNLVIEDFKYVVEVGGMNAIKSLVEYNCGITFLYEAVVKKELKSGTLRELKLEDFEVTHDFAFIWNHGSLFSDHYQKLFKLLKG
ncbi:LysR family transcriptional regulator [Acetobacterium paludosum]|uniref:LysR family transcriptional regulator n=1 Tax=Acetobacterium paludosum TaxID=52693 RepID=A0A923I0Q5_9FIRM|nr:LysR family transcriptional regulator [Acetobacterium paludosum]MBC3886995.1 LysR family transcriptional regulator [Acetobacterium paludosum]